MSRSKDELITSAKDIVNFIEDSKLSLNEIADQYVDARKRTGFVPKSRGLYVYEIVAEIGVAIAELGAVIDSLRQTVYLNNDAEDANLILTAKEMAGVCLRMGGLARALGADIETMVTDKLISAQNTPYCGEFAKF